MESTMGMGSIMGMGSTMGMGFTMGKGSKRKEISQKNNFFFRDQNDKGNDDDVDEGKDDDDGENCQLLTSGFAAGKNSRAVS